MRYPDSMKRRKPPGRAAHGSGGVTDADGLRLGEILRQTARDQIRAGEPPQVAATYRRLLAEGQAETNAIELITAVLAAEMYAIMNEQRPFDEANYNRNLRRLPELPYESDA